MINKIRNLCCKLYLGTYYFFISSDSNHADGFSDGKKLRSPLNTRDCILRTINVYLWCVAICMSKMEYHVDKLIGFDIF